MAVPPDVVARVEWSEIDEPVASRIVRTVAAASDRPAAELPSLYEVVDPDALEMVFSDPLGCPPRSAGTVSFPYAGFRVTLSADGTIELEPEHGSG